jgi:hypothetical protein
MPEDQCAYRSELVGLYCQFWFLVLFSEFYGLTNLTFTTISDCEGALTAVYKEKFSWNTPHRDVISGCLSAITRATLRGIKFIPQHVYGHQTRMNPFAVLSLDAQLNEHADAMAGDY